MELTTISLYAPEPGDVWEWPVISSEEPSKSPIGPSFNQRFHLAGAESDPDGRSVWLAAAFSVTGTFNKSAMTKAFQAFLARHSTLHSEFRPENSAGELSRFIHNARVANPHKLHHNASTPAEMQKLLRETIEAHCMPFHYPAIQFLVIERPIETTVIAAFDHQHCDAFSITLAISELSRDYSSACDGHALSYDQIGSFLTDTEHEATLPPPSHDDRRIRRWIDHVRHAGGTAPSFPLPLGTTGAPAPQGDDTRQLLTSAEAQTCENLFRASGASMFTGLATALGTAIRTCGGPNYQDVLIPVHTRHDEITQRTFGWYTNTIPLTIAAHDNNFASSAAETHAAFRRALELAQIPLAHVLGAIGDEFQRTRQDVYMMSYVDYRKLPTVSGPNCGKPVHISNSTAADDAQFWLWRDEAGVSLRSRFPLSPTALETMQRFWKTLNETLNDALRG